MRRNCDCRKLSSAVLAWLCSASKSTCEIDTVACGSAGASDVHHDGQDSAAREQHTHRKKKSHRLAFLARNDPMHFNQELLKSRETSRCNCNDWI